MSFLTPLYILGALTVIGPLVFHLIRRTPKGEVPFSSLMFLTPTPPRLTRRSRLDNLLLLLLRAGALCLLAAAFARPFWRQVAQLDFGDTERRRTVVLIDTSASMKRGDLWSKAISAATRVIADANPGDELAILSFDTTSHPVLGFEESATLESGRREAVADARIRGLTPSWGATDLGRGLVDAVAAIEDVADKTEKAGRIPRRVVLISDLQQGARLDALGEFAWPSDVDLELKTLTIDGSNAGLSALADATELENAGTEAERKIRVSNDAASTRESFKLVWLDEKGVETDQPIEAYVPPGESRVVRIPRPKGAATLRSLRLEGDVHGYDNALYFADETREEATVGYIGTDTSEDTTGLLYYLHRVFQDTPRRTVRVVPTTPSADLTIASARSTPLMIVTSETTPDNIRKLQSFVRNGGTLLDVITKTGQLTTLASLADVDPFDVKEAAVERDTMLGAIAFEHPLFAPLAGAGFNDFTKVRFWKYRKLDPKALGDVHVIAHFENGDPAIIEKRLGKGSLVVMTSGWQPSDSQFARSSKFVPLMTALLDARDPLRFESVSVKVFDRVSLPARETTAPATLFKPSGTKTAIIADHIPGTETDEPGVYTLDIPGNPKPIAFAVNLDPAESKTSPLAVETLEQFGCKLANPSRKLVDAEQVRQMHNGELESRQKLWRWLILAAIGVLIVETWLAGRLSRPAMTRAEGLAT